MAGLNLLSLLGQVAGGAAGMRGADAVASDEEAERLAREGITVNGGNAAADPAAPPKANPLNARRMEPYNPFSDRSSIVAPTKEQMKEKIPRQGMFGVKGTLRDVLGVLGDTMLMASGEKAYYRPIRQNERAGDARLGVTGGPAARREAIERTAQIDPDAADKMMSAYDMDQYRTDNLASQDENRKSLADARREAAVGKLVGLNASRFSAAGNDPNKIAYALQLAQQDADRNGVSLEDLGIQENLTPEQLAVVAGSGMNVNQQHMDADRDASRGLAERRIGVTEQTFKEKKNGGMFKRPPPRPGPQPRAEGVDDKAIRLGNKPDNELTKGEKIFLKRYQDGTGKSRGSGRRSVSPDKPSGSGVSRVINGRTFTIRQ